MNKKIVFLIGILLLTILVLSGCAENRTAISQEIPKRVAPIYFDYDYNVVCYKGVMSASEFSCVYIQNLKKKD